MPADALLNGKWRDELIVVSVLEAVVFMAVKGIESFITAESPDDALTYVGAVAVFILSLTAFRAFTAGGKPSRPGGSGSR